jgi:hypothetical protein
MYGRNGVDLGPAVSGSGTERKALPILPCNWSAAAIGSFALRSEQPQWGRHRTGRIPGMTTTCQMARRLLLIELSGSEPFGRAAEQGNFPNACGIEQAHKDAA